MPKGIVTTDGREFAFREYALPDLEPNQVRVKVEFASPKHGTEGHAFAGSPFDTKLWNPDLRMFLPKSADAPVPTRSERGVGNIVVGTITEAGPEVTRFAVGDQVFGYSSIREVHQAPQERLTLLQGLGYEDAVCTDPAHVAFVAVRDGNVRIGDDVAVFGLGAIGLLAVQIARAGGAHRVFAVDPLPTRRACAERHGADAAFDPSACDVALEIKRATAGKGVDVSVETSGNARALHESIRCIRQCGTVVHVPWGPTSCADLRLDEEFHLNRPTLIGSQAWEGWGNPDRDYPLWDAERARQAVTDLFRGGKITGKDVVTPIVPFSEAPAALARAFADASQAIKLGVTFV